MNDERLVEINLDDMEKVSPTPFLNLPDLTEEACYIPKDHGSYRVFLCKPSGRPQNGCPACHWPILSVHGYLPQRRLVHDINIGVEQVDILIQVPRYRCEDCGHTFTHQFESIVESRQMTHRLHDQIKRESYIRPFTDVAAYFGYSIPTVAAIFDEYTAELEKQREEIIAPRILGIDEKHIVNALRGVFVDIETGTLLEMTPGNKRSDIIETIQGMKDYDKNIEIVTMDMSGGYRSYVHECLPNAKIIVDKYHVVQLMGTKVRTTRTKLIEYVKQKLSKMAAGTEKAHLQEVFDLVLNNSYLFKFGQEKLAEKNHRVQAMADVCMTFPEFNHLRLLKEGFELIYDCQDREAAETVALEWAKLVPPSGARQMEAWQQEYHVPPELFVDFRALKRTLNSWHEEIFMYFEKGCQATNAATEGLNNLIERFNRLGNGYSFERLRAKALYWHLAGCRKKYRINAKQVPVYKEKPLSKCFDTSYLGMIYAVEEIIRYDLECHIEAELHHVIRDPLSVFLYLPDDRIPS